MFYIFLAFMALAAPCHAAINDADAVKAIIGEFENDNIELGACALANRGTLSGVYGLKSLRVVKRLYSRAIYARAARAWTMAKEGLGCGPIKGAGHWQSVSDMNKPAIWRDSCIMTFKTDKTFFFKCGRY
jgi:hypothetical protein